jgi:hypothetical protein
VSVLPDPVGAQMSVCSPGTMLRPALHLRGVGSGNDAANHSRTAGENAVEHGVIGDARNLPTGYDTRPDAHPRGGDPGADHPSGGRSANESNRNTPLSPVALVARRATTLRHHPRSPE